MRVQSCSCWVGVLRCWDVGVLDGLDAGVGVGTYLGAAVPQQLRDVVDHWISHYELEGNQLVLYLDEVCPPVSPYNPSGPMFSYPPCPRVPTPYPILPTHPRVPPRVLISVPVPRSPPSGSVSVLGPPRTRLWVTCSRQWQPSMTTMSLVGGAFSGRGLNGWWSSWV